MRKLGKGRTRGTQNRATCQIETTDQPNTIILNPNDPETLKLIEAIASGLVEVPRANMTDLFRGACQDMNNLHDTTTEIAEIQVALIIIMFHDAIDATRISAEERAYLKASHKSYLTTKPLPDCDSCISKMCPVASSRIFFNPNIPHPDNLTPCPIESAWARVYQTA